MTKYTLTDKFKGYNSKVDSTKLGNGFLVEGSQNVLSTDGENIKIREGYTLDGAANTALNPIESSYEWNTHSNTGLHLRSYDDELEFRYVASDGTVTWTRLKDGWSAVDFNYAEYWDNTEKQDYLLFVNGDDSIYAWSGGVTTIASVTTNTITKNGTDTWAQARFNTGTGYDKIVTINGTDYTYTGGHGTTTLTGVTPDPSGEAADSIAFQTITTTADTPAADATLFSNDLISVLNNQIWVASTINRDVYVSKQNDYTDFTYASPRLPAEGALLTLDAYPIGFAVQEQFMFITAGKDQWYKIKFTLSNDLTKEAFEVKRLKTTAQEAAASQSAIGYLKNRIVYLSNEPTIDTLGRLENIDTPQTLPLSDAIKTELEDYDRDNAHIKYFRNKLYVALPDESRVLIYDIENGYWEAPQVLPVRRFAIIGGELYAHSNSVPETYKLFDGYNDNTNPIEAVATFSYENYDDRVNLKSFDEFFSEGFIKSNTDLTLEINFDYQGYTSTKEYTIEGDDDAIRFQLTQDASVGKDSFGKQPLGSQLEDIEDLAKFKVIHSGAKVDFQEVQISYKSNQIDGRWEILAFGPNVYVSNNQPINIKK